MGDQVFLHNGARPAISIRIVNDAYYGEVLAAEQDGTKQKVAQVALRVNGNLIASATAGYLDHRHGGHLAMLNILVLDDWRRQGVATAIYDAIEQHYADQVLPYPGNEGGPIQSFWINRLKQQPDLLNRYLEHVDIVESTDGAYSPR